MAYNIASAKSVKLNMIPANATVAVIAMGGKGKVIAERATFLGFFDGNGNSTKPDGYMSKLPADTTIRFALPSGETLQYSKDPAGAGCFGTPDANGKLAPRVTAYVYQDIAADATETPVAETPATVSEPATESIKATESTKAKGKGKKAPVAETVTETTVDVTPAETEASVPAIA